MSDCNCHTAFPFSICNPSISSALVYYSGPNLPCSGINNKDSITTAIQKIDAQLCGENLVNNVFSAILNDADLYQQSKLVALLPNLLHLSYARKGEQ